jgi:uncharacterized protein YukE
MSEPDWEAESLRGRLEDLRRQMNELLPGWGDVEVEEFDSWLAAERSRVLERFWRS